MRELKESYATVAGAGVGNAAQVMVEGRLISFEEYDARLRQVTPDDLRRVLANMLKDGKYALSAVGPQDTMPSDEEIRQVMLAQVQGVAIPAPRVPEPLIVGKFNKTAKKKRRKTVAPKVRFRPDDDDGRWKYSGEYFGCPEYSECGYYVDLKGERVPVTDGNGIALGRLLDGRKTRGR